MTVVRTSAEDKAATPVAVAASGMLTSSQFDQLAEVPPALTWFANIDNRHAARTRTT